MILHQLASFCITRACASFVEVDLLRGGRFGRVHASRAAPAAPVV